MRRTWEAAKRQDFNPPFGFFVGNTAAVERLKIPTLNLQASTSPGTSEGVWTSLDPSLGHKQTNTFSGCTSSPGSFGFRHPSAPDALASGGGGGEMDL